MAHDNEFAHFIQIIFPRMGVPNRMGVPKPSCSMEVSGMKTSTPTENFSVEVPFGGTCDG